MVGKVRGLWIRGSWFVDSWIVGSWDVVSTRGVARLRATANVEKAVARAAGPSGRQYKLSRGEPR